MKFPRSALSVAVVEGSLFALGGYDGADFLASVEYYNFEKVGISQILCLSKVNCHALVEFRENEL